MAPKRPALSRVRTLIIGLALTLALAGCGRGHSGNPPLYVQTTASILRGPILVEHVTYTTFDGFRVPALLALPRAYPARGCLIWAGALGSTKESSETLWEPLARLGLATFAITLRGESQHAGAQALARVVRSPRRLARLLTASVKDLARATNYLWAQPSCRHNLAFAGVGVGGMVGSILAAKDSRIRAVVLVSVPPTWAALITTARRAFPRIAAQTPLLTADLGVLSALDPDRWLGGIAPRPSLFLFGLQNPLVPPSLARKTVAAAGEPKTVVYYGGASPPLSGGTTSGNPNPIELFLLKYLVEPTFPLPRPTLPPLP